MEVHVSCASAVVVQRVPAALTEWFMEWQRGISEAAKEFPGYRGTEVYPPADCSRDEWVVILHFDEQKSLQGWLDSSVRAECVERLLSEVGSFELKMLPGGFGAWFASQGHSTAGSSPSSWKMALTVLLGLYPTVMLLTLFPGPYTQPLGPALAMLIGNVLSVSLLQWCVMPMLNALLAPWLQTNSIQGRTFSTIGALVILFVLAGLVLLFRQVTG